MSFPALDTTTKSQNIDCFQSFVWDVWWDTLQEDWCALFSAVDYFLIHFPRLFHVKQWFQFTWIEFGFSSYPHRLIILMIDYYCCLFCFNCIDLSRIHFLYIGFLSCTRYFVLFSCANLIVSPSLYYRWAALFNSELFVMCKEDIRLFWVLYFWFNLCNLVDYFKY